MSRLLKLYAQTLKLCPKEFQDQYARPMLQTMEDMLDDQPDRAARCKVWLRATLDLPISITQLNTTLLGGNLMNSTANTPNYGKQTGIAGGLLLVPFIVIIASGVLHNQQITQNHAWVTALIIGLIVLPAMAFVLNVVSYIAWFKAQAKRQHSLIKRVFDVSHTWPMLVAGGIGLVFCLFVPFHDSASCLVGNPVRIVHNPQQTIQCIDDGFMGGK